MSKIAVVYWSGTGNTEMMAKAVAGACEGKLFTADEFTADMVSEYDAIAFGCPSMGAEELEDTEFEPMYSACKGALSGKRVALFGSFGWGDGEWMRNWEEDIKGTGAEMACDFVICQEEPDAEALAACEELGKALL